MKKVAFGLACAVTALASGTGNAAVINFSGLSLGETSGSLVIGAYQISPWYGATAVAFLSNDGAIALGDTTATQGFGSAFTLSRVDGGAFTVNSLVFGYSGPDQAGGSYDVRVGVAPYDGGQTVYVHQDGQSFTGIGAIANVTEVGFDAYTDVGAVGLRSIDVTASAGGDDAGAVPEPATWGMMIVGFGGVGAALRRRAGVRRVTFA